LRISCDVRDFGWESAHGAVSRRPPISLDRMVVRTGATRTPLGFGLCLSFKGDFLSRRGPKHSVTIRNFCIDVRAPPRQFPPCRMAWVGSHVAALGELRFADTFSSLHTSTSVARSGGGGRRCAGGDGGRSACRLRWNSKTIQKQFETIRNNSKQFQEENSKQFETIRSAPGRDGRDGARSGARRRGHGRLRRRGRLAHRARVAARHLRAMPKSCESNTLGFGTAIQNWSLNDGQTPNSDVVR
jgi:hypothetical protein